jgi:pyruvate formate lyase activating enzyme
MSVDELLEEAKKDSIVFKHSGGGVTLSGGEPLLHPDYNRRLVSALKEEGISVGVDTCGQVPWSNVEAVLPYVNFFLWDIKHMDPEQHKKFTGVSNSLILSNIQAVSERNIPIYIRIPVIPGYNDSEENIRATSEFVINLSSVVEVDLLPLHHLGKARYDSLHRAYPLGNTALVPDNIMQDIKQIVTSYQLNCNVVG